MSRVLILYSTTDGHTVRICERLRGVLEASGNEVALAAVDEARQVDAQAFDKIVIGASVRYGHHQRAVSAFIERHLPLLTRTPSAFFSVNIVARKPAKNRPETNPYLIKFLRRTPWKPDRTAVFAGKLDYPKYGWLDRTMIRFIMLMTKGPTDPATVVEFTDWHSVDAFARVLCELEKKTAGGGAP